MLAVLAVLELVAITKGLGLEGLVRLPASAALRYERYAESQECCM